MKISAVIRNQSAKCEIVVATGGSALRKVCSNRHSARSRIACWSKVLCMVNSTPGFDRQPAVINGFTELIVNVFEPERGAHARSAVGLAELPFRIPVEIEGELELLPR